MRKVAIIAAYLCLSGCAGNSILQGGSSFTTPINNPVTPTMLYEAENVFTIAVTGALSYKNLCVRKLVPDSCRNVVGVLQSYSRQAKPMLVTLRRFVRDNDQVNAVTVYNSVRQLLANFQQVAAASGVR